MALVRTTDSRSFSIQVRKGTDANGNPTYNKKSFSNVASDASDEKIYNVAAAIKDVLLGETGNIFISQTDQLTQA